MGVACEERCLNGTGRIRSDSTAVCDCDKCYTGAACDKECSGHGTCRNGTCNCGFEGWRGINCDVKGCPGWGTDCSGHGDCIPSTGQCICRSGWGGLGCEIPQCPGGGNCSSHGVCDGINFDPPKCVSCFVGYMGRGCELKCVYGNVSTSLDSSGEEIVYRCVCDKCYSGIACDEECSLHGNCSNGTCSCAVGWRGDVCSKKGCPGRELDCSGKGVCLISSGQCVCYNGWKGTGCETPDCPGTPDCNNVGICDGSVDPPVCINCTNGTMGTACNQPCLYGSEDMSRRGICICDSCYEGFSCDILCDGNGICLNSTCKCDQGWKGKFCKDVDCPGEPDCSGRGACISVPNSLPVCSCNSGFSGANCSQLVCPGEPACSDRGKCVLSNNRPTCLCDHGFDGDSCQRCKINFAEPFCDKCIDNYIGFKTDCSVRCVHGSASTLGGKVCICHNNNTFGHWNGTTCESCSAGYALPSCTYCDATHAGENCTVDCVRANARYKDPFDKESPTKLPILPQVNCFYTDNENATIFWLGYENRNPATIYLQNGSVNGMFWLPSPYLLPGGEVGSVIGYFLNSTMTFENMSQPAKFRPGKHSMVFKMR